MIDDEVAVLDILDTAGQEASDWDSSVVLQPLAEEMVGYLHTVKILH